MRRRQDPLPRLAASVLPNATVGIAYSTTLNATGGVARHSWAVASGEVPVGIAGTPTSTGQWTFAMQVTDAKGSSATVSFSLAVATPTTPPAAAASNNRSGYVLTGAPYTGVTGTFNVPRLNSAATDAMASQGRIDGATNSSLIQASVAEQYSASTNLRTPSR